MKNFKVVSRHEVYEDSYLDGELNYVNGYTLDNTVSAENVKEAIEKYFEGTLFYDLDFKFADVADDKSCLRYSVLVDEDNIKAEQNEIEQWRGGQKKLYSNHIYIEVYQLKLSKIEL